MVQKEKKKKEEEEENTLEKLDFGKYLPYKLNRTRPC